MPRALSRYKDTRGLISSSQCFNLERVTPVTFMSFFDFAFCCGPSVERIMIVLLFTLRCGLKRIHCMSPLVVEMLISGEEVLIA